MCEMSTGIIALVGGAEWTVGCEFDSYLLEASGSKEVTVLPTAAAYERPELAVQHAQQWFSALGARVNPVMVLTRKESEDEIFARQIENSSFIYLSGGSPMHLFSVLDESKCFQAIISALHKGAVLAGSSAGAMVLTDPMVDMRGGGLTLGLGLLKNLAILPHYNSASNDLRQRVVSLAEPEVVVAGIDEKTALIRSADGEWTEMGTGQVHLSRAGTEFELNQLKSAIGTTI